MVKDDLRLDKLRQLYDLYDLVMAKDQFVCYKGCATCCTCNVTLTSLELDYIKVFLGPEKEEAMIDIFRKNLPLKRFQPKTTMNGFARLCMEGGEVLEEENDPLWGVCPLLLNNVCTIYPVRPFGCRSLVSKEDCALHGVATVPAFVLTLNNIFMQYLEHMDCRGVSGNIFDMVLAHSSDLSFPRIVTINNQEAMFLMVPPEHRERVRPLLKDIARITRFAGI